MSCSSQLLLCTEQRAEASDENSLTAHAPLCAQLRRTHSNNAYCSACCALCFVQKVKVRVAELAAALPCTRSLDCSACVLQDSALVLRGPDSESDHPRHSSPIHRMQLKSANRRCRQSSIAAHCSDDAAHRNRLRTKVVNYDPGPGMGRAIHHQGTRAEAYVLYMILPKKALADSMTEAASSRVFPSPSL